MSLSMIIKTFISKLIIVQYVHYNSHLSLSVTYKHVFKMLLVIYLLVGISLIGYFLKNALNIILCNGMYQSCKESFHYLKFVCNKLTLLL